MKWVRQACLVLASASFCVVPLAGQLPEIGPNDFRLSVMAGIGAANFDAFQPAVAYNPDSDGYLAVWRGDGGPNQADNVYEIYGQFFARSFFWGPFLRISDMGPDNDSDFGADSPDVACDGTHQQFLVVWRGNDVELDFQIYGQLLTASGLPIGGGFQISQDVKPLSPAVVYNEVDDEYLVVWRLDDGTVLGQRLDGATGTSLGDVAIGTLGSAFANVAVAFNPQAGEYLVVWPGVADFGSGPEVEILGQRLEAATGSEVGLDDFRISDMGDDGDIRFEALGVDVTYNPADNQYLVVWHGDDNVLPLVDEELEIFGQRLDATGGALGSNDFRISDMGGSRESMYDAHLPVVAYDPTHELYVVSWHGDDNEGGLVEGEREIFIQTLDRMGVAEGPNDLRISDVAGVGDPLRGGLEPAIAVAGDTGELLVVWHADDDLEGQVDNEFEIFAQRLEVRWKILCDGFETGDMSAWSSVQ